MSVPGFSSGRVADAPKGGSRASSGQGSADGHSVHSAVSLHPPPSPSLLLCRDPPPLAARRVCQSHTLRSQPLGLLLLGDL